MALTPEDGTGLASADSYASVTQADEYHAARGNAAWAALAEPAKESALRRSTDYMVQEYRARWAGVRATGVQALDWPRSGVIVDGFEVVGVPVEVVRACCELALKASTAALSADTGRTVTREKVDVIEVEYSEFGPTGTQYTAVNAMLRPFFGVGGLNRSLVRS